MLCALLLCAFPLTLTACKGSTPPQPSVTPSAGASVSPSLSPSVTPSAPAPNPVIEITLTDGRKMTAELYPNIAPQTVARVLALVDQNLYDGVIFHRVIENFMIQTGGFIPSAQGLMQLSAPSLYGEFYLNGFYNPLLHEPGVLSMARTNALNGASTQFFICTEESPHLDGYYAAFGKLVDAESLAVAMDISKVETGAKYVFGTDAPLEDIVIQTIRRK